MEERENRPTNAPTKPQPRPHPQPHPQPPVLRSRCPGRRLVRRTRARGARRLCDLRGGRTGARGSGRARRSGHWAIERERENSHPRLLHLHLHRLQLRHFLRPPQRIVPHPIASFDAGDCCSRRVRSHRYCHHRVHLCHHHLHHLHHRLRRRFRARGTRAGPLLACPTRAGRGSAMPATRGSRRTILRCLTMEPWTGGRE